MGLTLVTAPATEPVELLEAKAHLRLDDDFFEEDDLVTDLLVAARTHVENMTGRGLITQGWRLSLDRFPAWNELISLQRAPVKSVESVKYLDDAGALQTLAPSQYVVDASGRSGGKIGLAFGASWPSTRGQLNAVTIDFTIGDAKGAVPSPLKSAIKLLLADLYMNRESNIVGTIVSENPTVAALVSPYRIALIG